MSVKVFVDTNLWVYLYSSDDVKHRDVVSKLLDGEELVIISTQVINEFANVMFKKFKLDSQKIILAIDEIIAASQIYSVDVETVRLAISVVEKHKYSYFDSLMVAAAYQSDCFILYTEDMHHSQVLFDSLKIINPFK